ncbi:MAG: FmdB family zinc ribbon protein [Burkholderiales bacterium]
MPIYAYKCESCGFAKDVLQKMSDAPIEVCPACSESSFKKQLTAAGFQLKGSGWYATDFKGGSTASPAAVATADTGAASTGAVSEAPKADATPKVSAPKVDSGG